MALPVFFFQAPNRWWKMSNNEGETTEGSPASLPIHQVDGDESPTNSERPMAWYRFEGVAIAQGYNLVGWSYKLGSDIVE